MKQLSVHEQLEDFTVIFAKEQTQGKGQLGTEWKANKGENLTFSVFYNSSFLALDKQFYLNCAVSVAVFNVLQKLCLPQLYIKWPNDILSGNKKVSGILIENIVRSTTEKHSIIGIGLNVNQVAFDESFRASSLQQILGKYFNLEELLVTLVVELKRQLQKLSNLDFNELYESYQAYLFRKNKPSTFKNAEGVMFSGFIKSVTPEGKLQVILEDEVIKEFRLKEVKLMY